MRSMKGLKTKDNMVFATADGLLAAAERLMERGEITPNQYAAMRLRVE